MLNWVIGSHDGGRWEGGHSAEKTAMEAITAPKAGEYR